MSPERAALPHEDALSNADLAPTSPSQRTWGMWHFAALWVGMSVCIPTYMLAASMIASGLNWWQSLAIIVLGNAIVLLPMIVTGHAGTRYGIPFPVFARASYGVRGAHVPALLRSLVACGWFGIQTWIGGLAISALLGSMWPAWLGIGGGERFMGHSVPEFLGFLLFWLMNLYFVWNGTESIKWLETLSAPFLIVTGLLCWCGQPTAPAAWAPRSRRRIDWSERPRSKAAASSSPCSCPGSPRWSATGRLSP